LENRFFENFQEDCTEELLNSKYGGYNKKPFSPTGENGF
jgi:hypothetical protein